MVNTQELKTHVTEQTKRMVQALVAQHGFTEAAWLRRLVETTLQAANPNFAADDSGRRRCDRPNRLTIQVSADDHDLLEARAEARYLAPSTYVWFFLRAHLRALAPLPSAELGALKRAVAELAAIGRNINQIARAVQQSGRAAGPEHQELVALLKVCEGLRDHVKSLIKANLASWEIGHAAPTDH